MLVCYIHKGLTVGVCSICYIKVLSRNDLPYEYVVSVLVCPPSLYSLNQIKHRALMN